MFETFLDLVHLWFKIRRLKRIGWNTTYRIFGSVGIIQQIFSDNNLMRLGRIASTFTPATVKEGTVEFDFMISLKF